MMFLFCRFFGSLLFCSLVSDLAQAQSDNPLFDNVAVHQNLVYATPGGDPLKLDLYVPKGSDKPLPVVMWVHGGSWEGGDKSDSYALPLLKSGFAVASINYRLSQTAIFPAQLMDCKAAVRWLRTHAGRYNLNPDKIGAAGASAGGHLVALLGTTDDLPALEGHEGYPGVSSRVQAVCDFFGPTDFPNWNKGNLHPVNFETPDNAIARLIGGAVTTHENLARAASPVYYVSAHACPFYIAHGDQDVVVPLEQSIELNEALQKAGVPSSLYVVKGAGHGFNDPIAWEKAVAFLKHYLQSP
jgi:acetyl esterase/lipase